MSQHILFVAEVNAWRGVFFLCVPLVLEYVIRLPSSFFQLGSRAIIALCVRQSKTGRSLHAWFVLIALFAQHGFQRLKILAVVARIQATQDLASFPSDTFIFKNWEVFFPSLSTNTDSL